MWISLGNRNLPPYTETFRLDDAIIKKVENANFSEALLDQDLSWNEQTSNNAKKLGKYVHNMCASRQYHLKNVSD